MKTIKSLLIITLIPVVLCCSCAKLEETIAPTPTTPQPTIEITPTATEAMIDEEQAIALAREVAIEYLGYDKTKLATQSDMETLKNENFETLRKGEIRYFDDMDTMAPEVKHATIKIGKRGGLVSAHLILNVYHLV